MKTRLTLLAALLLPAPVLLAQTTTAEPRPTVTITTPAGIPGGKGVVTGTAQGGTTGTGTDARAAFVKDVLYQFEGQSKWRKAKILSNVNATDVTWMIDVKIPGATGKRIYFRAVDTNRADGDVVGRRFVKSS